MQVDAGHNVCYQWVKGGCPLQEGGGFVGVHDPILCITDASSAMAGTYVCKITECEDSNSSVCSEPVLLAVSLPPLKKILVDRLSSLKKVLVDRYSAQPEVPKDSWPPVSSNTFINLALIKKGSINKAGEYARSTIQGDVDDIIADKEKIEYEKAFTELESGALLLIEGRPGSGITTLVHKFSRDWARGNCKLNFTRYSNSLFLVHLRGFFNDPNIEVTGHHREILLLKIVDQVR